MKTCNFCEKEVFLVRLEGNVVELLNIYNDNP